MINTIEVQHPWPVVVVSPCGSLPDPGALDRGVQTLRAAGHHVEVPTDVYARYQRFAGDDKQRMAALLGALGASALVMASRGGYGASRLLHQVDWHAVAQGMQQSGTVLCGHSDLTSIQLALLACGAPAHALLHGPMVCFDFGQPSGVDVATYAYFDAATRLACVDIAWSYPQGLYYKDFAPVHGPVWGGNLSVLCALLGTPFWPNIKHGILVLEDVNEPVYKIERMLLQLFHAGVLHEQQAVVLGQFNPPKPVAHDQGYGFEAMVAYLQALLPCPVLVQFPFGHCTPKACWYQGFPGTLSLDHFVLEGFEGNAVTAHWQARLVQKLRE